MSNIQQQQKHVEKVREAVKAATVPNASKVRELWLEAATSLAKGDQRVSAGTKERKGGYILAVEAAVAAGALEPFTTVTDQVFAEIRSNANGIAKRLGCVLGKSRKGAPAAYLIPSSLMSAKSVLSAAFERNIALTEKVDDEVKPRAFTAIRTNVREAGEAERVAQLTGRERSVYMVRVMATKVADAAEAFTVTELPDVLERLTALVKIATMATERSFREETEAASRGADLADDGNKAARAA